MKKLISIMCSISIVGTTVTSVVACRKPEEEGLVIASFWQKGSIREKGLMQLVDRFNNSEFGKTMKKPARVEQLQQASLDQVVAQGITRKLPNIITSYGDKALEYDLKLTSERYGAKMQDLSDVIPNKESIYTSFLDESVYNNKMYVAPLGKSVDYMFINKRILALVFNKLGLQRPLEALYPDSTIRDEVLSKTNYPVKSSKPDGLVVPPAIEQADSMDKIKALFNNFNSFLELLKLVSAMTDANDSSPFNKVYTLGIDDIPNYLNVWYANEGALDSREVASQKYIYNEKNNTAALNLNADSEKILKELVDSIQQLKNLAPRQSADSERYGGLRTKSDSSLSYNSEFFNKNQMFINFSSSAGIYYLINADANNGINADDILPLPVTVKNEQKNIIQQGPGLAMFELKNETRNQYAREFIKFATSQNENDQLSLDTGYWPIHENSYQADSEYMKGLTKQIQELEGKTDANSKRNLEAKKLTKNVMSEVYNSIKNKDFKYVTIPLVPNGDAIRRKVIYSAFQSFIEDLKNGSYNPNDKPTTVEDVIRELRNKMENI